MTRAVELTAAGVFALLLVALASRIVALVDGPEALLILPPAVLLGILATDLVSGLVHWLCDTYGEEDTPLLGPLLIGPFREHHRDPLLITRRGFLSVNHTNCLGIDAVLGLCLWLGRPTPGDRGSLFGLGFLLSFSCAVYLTNTFHQWAHAPRIPALARWLQRARLVLSPAHHARHHAAGYGNFCITTGWLDPVLERWRIFPGLERALSSRFRLGRPRPRRNPEPR